MNDNPGFELHGLQKLFATSASTVVYTGRFLFDPLVIREFVIAEVARIKHRLIEKALTIEAEDSVRRYVRLHQYSIVSIMDHLFRRSDQEGAMECCDVLDGLLSFLKEHFLQYFDELAKAPMKHVHEARIDIVLCFGLLEQKLLSTCTFQPLIYIILDPLDRFYSKGDEQRVSFSRLRYLRYVLEHSKKVAQDKCDSDYYGRNLVEMMLYLNYNSRKTFMQFVQFLRAFLPTDLDIDTRIHNIRAYLKIATQATVKPNTGYHPHSPTLRNQLIDYLAVELRDLSKKKAQEEEACPVKAGPVPPFKVKLNLSVAQLGCWLRLCMEAGLIAIGNTSELLRFVALHCETKRAGQISAESLRIKFYDIEEGTRRAVQEKLVGLLKSAEGLLE